MADVQLRRYKIVPGKMDLFLQHWQRVVPVREKYGFTVLFAFADRASNEFFWAVSHDGDFDEADRAYKKDPGHGAASADLHPTLDERQAGMVDVIVSP